MAIDPLKAAGLTLALIDPAAPAGQRQLYPGPSATGEDGGRGAGPSWSMPIEVSGRTLSLAARRTRAFQGGQAAWPAWAVLAAGLLFTLLVCVYVDIVLRRAILQRELAEELARVEQELGLGPKQSRDS